MMEVRTLKKVVKCVKSTDESYKDFQIPIFNSSDIKIGFLIPIRSNMVEDRDILLSLTKWRRASMRCFLTQFIPTVERTSNWLTKVVVPSDNRVLFLICDSSDIPIGNFGICNIQSDIAELDNLIRGEKSGDSNLIYYAGLHLLQWMFSQLQIPLATLHVFSNNEKAISLYERIGFRTVKKYKLWKKRCDDEIKFSTSDRSGEPTDFQYLEMMLAQSKFEKKYPNLKRSNLCMPILPTTNSKLRN